MSPLASAPIAPAFALGMRTVGAHLIPVTMAWMEIDSTLPYIDEHQVSVDASAPLAWAAVVDVFGRLSTKPGWRVFAQAIRCKPVRAAGTSGTVGTSLPGFLVARCEPPTEWALEGAHLFSRYALTFRIDSLDNAHCRVTARSSAEFPGLHGKMYRAVVIGTGGHKVGVRNILRSIKTEAEHSRA